jgi:hypothetical protein
MQTRIPCDDPQIVFRVRRVNVAKDETSEGVIRRGKPNQSWEGVPVLRQQLRNRIAISFRNSTIITWRESLKGFVNGGPILQVVDVIERLSCHLISTNIRRRPF